MNKNQKILFGFLAVVFTVFSYNLSRIKTLPDSKLEPIQLSDCVPFLISDFQELEFEENTLGEESLNSNIILSNNKDNSSPTMDFASHVKNLQKQFPNLFFVSGSANRKDVALTFDDGPDGKTTPAILSILEEYAIPATFFLTGENIEKHPSIVKQIIDKGHQVANHSLSHLRPTTLEIKDFCNEVVFAQNILKKHIELTNPYYYRPPYGLLYDDQIKEIEQKGYVVICWSIDSLDWATSNPDEILNNVINSIHPGAIILMHSAGGKDQRQGTIKALPGIISKLSEEGYRFVTVKELIRH